jgi:hypothetical protein
VVPNVVRPKAVGLDNMFIIGEIVGVIVAASPRWQAFAHQQ